VSNPLGRLWHYAERHRGRVLVAASFSVLNRIFDLAPPALIGAAIDVVVQRESSLLGKLGVPNLRNQLFLLAAVTVAVWVAESLFEYWHKLWWRNLAQTMQHELRIDAYTHVQTLDMKYFEDRSTGGLMAILNDDINQLERFLNGGANDLIQVATSVAVIGIAFFGTSPLVAVFAFLPIPLVLWGSFKFQQRIAPRYTDVRERVGMLNHQLAGSLSGIATVKSFVAEDHEVARVREASDAYRKSNSHAIRLSSAFSPLIRMAIVIGFTATLVLGGILALDGELAVGAYGVLVFLTQRLLWPLTRLGETVDLYQRAMASTTRVLDLLDEPIGIVDGDTPLAEVEGLVQFEDVSFAYQRKAPIVHGLSLEVPAGETVAIVGSTGSGKSTLVKLLLRFYDVDDGCIRIDGHNIRDLKLADLRRTIALVSQDVFLFHGSVRDNICYGSFDASDEQIVEAAKIAEAHDFISQLPDGYDTVVGERGQKLSGGQRQRISIARAVLADPPILVLDEATSSVDNETEAAIQRSLERIAVGRSAIVIAHRLSTVRNAHRIYVLDNGEVKEQGVHGALIEQGGIYAALWRVQTGEAVSATRPSGLS
jgi:ATP-binding cassette subfamily B protein